MRPTAHATFPRRSLTMQNIGSPSAKEAGSRHWQLVAGTLALDTPSLLVISDRMVIGGRWMQLKPCNALDTSCRVKGQIFKIRTTELAPHNMISWRNSTSKAQLVS